MPDTGLAADRASLKRSAFPPEAGERRPALGAPGGWLAVLVGAVLALLILLFVAMTAQDHDGALTDGWESAERAALSAADQAVRSVAAAQLVTDRVAEVSRRHGLNDFRTHGDTTFAAALRYAPPVASLWLMDARGRLIASSLPNATLPAGYATQPEFTALRGGADFAIGPMAFGRSSGEWCFTLTRAIRDEARRLVGVVRADIRADEFGHIRRNLWLDGGGQIGLFRASDGAPLMLSPAPPPGAEGQYPSIALAPDAAVLQAASAGQREGRFEARNPDGTSLLAAWRRADGDGRVIAIAALPRQMALAPFGTRLIRNALLLGIAAIVVIGLAWAVAAALAGSVALRRSAEARQRELAAVLEAAGEAVLVCDPEWRVSFVNRHAAGALTGASDVIGRTIWQAVPAVAGGRIGAACQRAMQSRLPASAEEELPGLGRRYHAEAQPREDGGLVLFLRDVTEEHAAAARLAESEARLRRVLDNLFVFVAVLAPDGTLLEANRAPLEAAGLTLADVQGLRFWDCHWWSHDPSIQAQLRAACARAADGESSRFDAVARMAGDSRMTVDFQIAPLRDMTGRVTHLIPSATDITARAEAEAALAESEARLRLAQEAAEVGVFERRLPGELAHWSASMFRLYGLPPEGRSPWVGAAEHLERLHPDERQMHAARREAMRQDPTVNRFSYEFRIIRADTGETRWLAARGEVVRDEEGRPLLVRGVNYDVTERRRGEERQLLLAREVDHRAKNALAVVQAIVGLTRDPDPVQFRAAVIGRIAAMARAHTLLAREGWGSAELRELVEAEIAPHLAAPTGGSARVRLDGPPVALAPGAAQPVAMALHELATNAVKYGALSQPMGQVNIAWTPTDEGGLLLRWTERGGPTLTGAPARRGFGSSVILNTVERQLGGQAAFDWAAEGLECRLTLPAGQLRWPDPPTHPAKPSPPLS